MTTSVASSNFNMASSICFAEINLIAMSLAMLPVAETLRRYMPEEPGGFDPRKNRPATHLRKGQKAQRVQKQKLPKENNTVVVGMIGTTVIMKCDVGLNDVTYLFQVIWARHAKSVNETDAEILTVNTTTLVDDKRFLVTHDSEQKIWHLHIRYTKHKDKGIYECQVCNHPTFSIYVKLDLFEARAVILGPSVREVDRGFPIRLSCILNSTEHYRMKTPTYMFWRANAVNFGPEIGTRYGVAAPPSIQSDGAAGAVCSYHLCLPMSRRDALAKSWPAGSFRLERIAWQIYI
ncbi:uncharacterized protein LOC143196094 isoform X5 [Rhynchophorus ferrugineus]|uniref:uncharacterized protein LOC143196094 isoform X5 n=1 Tax=Rhynchophorus ferrugineus TaxID=354439 RepID=UPI003FCE7318